MEKLRPPALEKAFEEMPITWYELSHREQMAFTIMSALGLHYSNQIFFHLDSLQTSITAAAIFAVSTIADRYSTAKGVKANMEAEQAGMEQPAHEHNTFVGELKTPEDVIKNKKMLAIDALGIGISTVFPGIGVGFALGKVQATANNLRVAGRINRAVRIQRLSE